jgi:hypothetical protein
MANLTMMDSKMMMIAAGITEYLYQLPSILIYSMEITSIARLER